MSSLYENAKQVAKTAASATLCGVGSAQRVAMDFLDKKTFGATNVATAIGNRITGRDPSTESKARRLNNALTSFCNVPRDTPVEDVPVNAGMEGGQCPGVLYGISGTWTLYNSDGSVDIQDSTFQGSTYGPAYVGPSEYWANGPVNRAALSIYGFTSSSARQVQSAGGSSDNRKKLVVTSLNVVRVDGQPDDCGNRPPTLPDSEPITDPSPPPTVNPDGDGNGNQYTFAPTVGIIYADVDGSIKVPVTVNIPEIDVDFNFDIDLTDPAAEPEPVGDPPATDDDGRPDPGGESGGGGAGDDFGCDPCAKLDEIIAKFDEQFAGTVIVQDCTGTDQGYIYANNGLTGIHDGIQSVQALLKATYEKIPCEAAETEVVALMPSDMYSEFNMESRLTLYFTTVEDYPKRTNTASKWNIEIPNPIENLDWCTHFDNFIVQKGTHFSRVTWNNSKVKTGLYCASAEEGNRVLDLIQALTTAVPSRRRISSVDSPKVPLSTSTIRVVRAYRSVIENGEVTSCTMYAPPNGPCQPPESEGG